jgi:hypothetical protein
VSYLATLEFQHSKALLNWQRATALAKDLLEMIFHGGVGEFDVGFIADEVHFIKCQMVMDDMR